MNAAEQQPAELTGAALVIDGRTARRNRNKDAVLDAMISLTKESADEPPIESIAERAGVSYRSVYRYFDDRTDLMLSAIHHVMGDVWRIFDVENIGEGTLDERIAHLISSRLDAYHELAPLTRLAVRRGATEPLVLEEFDNVRNYMRSQLETQFAPEFGQLDESERGLVVAALDVMFQFEALEFLSRGDGMTDENLERLLARHVRAHLAAAHVAGVTN
jgi:AcrR family transcriptional regulator